MANYTYVGPQDSTKDEVRFLLQDTRAGEWILSDEEIEYTIAKWGQKYSDSMPYVASVLAETIAARYAREASYSADGVSVGLGQVAQQYRDLAVQLRAQHKDLFVGGFPDVGGISPYEELDPELKNFSFGTGMHDNLEAGPQDYGNRGGTYYPIEENPGI